MRRLFIVLGLVVAFAAGSAGGYAARTVGTATTPASHSAAACPDGSHAVVWYTARTWACLPNS